MNLDRIIAVRTTKTVYRYGDTCIKAFGQEYSKEDVLGEALNQARIERLGLNVPKILGVTAIEDQWAIVSEYISGKTLAQLMQENYDGSSKNPYGRNDEEQPNEEGEENSFLEILQQL